MKIIAGKHIQAMSAANAVEFIKNRYPKATKKDLDDFKKRYFSKDKGAEKLNDGNAEAGKAES